MEHPPTPPGVHSEDDHYDSPPLPYRGSPPKVSKERAMMATQRLYSLSATKQRKRAKASKEIPKECTFKPKVNKSSKNRQQSGAPIGERLYKQKEDTQRRKEALKRRIQTETFRPKLATRGNRSRSRSKASRKRIDKLFNDSKTRSTKLQAAQKKKEQADKAFGYKPKISKKARQITNGRVTLNGGSTMIERAKRRQKQKQQRELKNCTFKPKFTRSRSAPKARVAGSFLERMNAFEAKKGQNISKLLQKQYNRDKKNLTFAPKRAGSRKKTRKKSSTDIGNRLYNMGREREKAMQKKIARKKREEVKKHRFRPNIGRSRSAGRARPSKSRTSIYDRLYGESRLLKQSRDKAVKEKEMKSMEGLFKPQIQSKIYEAPARSGSSIWERLAVQDVQNREQTHVEFQEQRSKNEMEDCTFAPRVDVEREEEEFEDIFDRLYETDIGATDVQATGSEHCTFEPELPETSMEIAGYSVNGDVYERLASLESKQQMQREMQEQKKSMEIKGCTFTPDLSNNEKVFGAPQPNASKDETFSRLATPKNKIPQSAGESKRKYSSKRRGKSSFMERVKQKARKGNAAQTSIKPKAAAASTAKKSRSEPATPYTPHASASKSVKPAPETPATPASSSDDEDSQGDGGAPLEF